VPQAGANLVDYSAWQIVSTCLSNFPTPRPLSTSVYVGEPPLHWSTHGFVMPAQFFRFALLTSIELQMEHCSEHWNSPFSLPLFVTSQRDPPPRHLFPDSLLATTKVLPLITTNTPPPLQHIMLFPACYSPSPRGPRAVKKRPSTSSVPLPLPWISSLSKANLKERRAVCETVSSTKSPRIGLFPYSPSPSCQAGLQDLRERE